MPANRTTRRAARANTGPELEALDAALALALDHAMALAGELEGAGALINARLEALVADRAPHDELAALVAAADTVATTGAGRGGVNLTELQVALAAFRRAGGAR